MDRLSAAHLETEMPNEEIRDPKTEPPANDPIRKEKTPQGDPEPKGPTPGEPRPQIEDPPAPEQPKGPTIVTRGR